MAEEPLLRGRTYLMRTGTKTVPATVAPIRYKLDVDTGDQIAANQLDLNEIGVVQLELGQPVAFDPYVENRDTGGFILIDRITNHTVGAGLLRFALRRGENVAWQAVEVDREARSSLKAQQPLRRLADRSPGRGEVLDREPRRAAALLAGTAHGAARRLEPPARDLEGSRLHARRPRREQPPRGGDREADDGRRPDRDRRVRLPLPRRPRDDACALRRGRVPRGARRPARGARRRARHDRALREGAGRRAREPHRCRRRVRAARGARAPPRHDVALDVEEAAEKVLSALAERGLLA